MHQPQKQEKWKVLTVWSKEEFTRSSYRGFVAQWLERPTRNRMTWQGLNLGGVALFLSSDPTVSSSIFVGKKGRKFDLGNGLFWILFQSFFRATKVQQKSTFSCAVESSAMLIRPKKFDFVTFLILNDFKECSNSLIPKKIPITSIPASVLKLVLGPCKDAIKLVPRVQAQARQRQMQHMFDVVVRGNNLSSFLIDCLFVLFSCAKVEIPALFGKLTSPKDLPSPFSRSLSQAASAGWSLCLQDLWTNVLFMFCYLNWFSKRFSIA